MSPETLVESSRARDLLEAHKKREKGDYFQISFFKVKFQFFSDPKRTLGIRGNKYHDQNFSSLYIQLDPALTVPPGNLPMMETNF